MMLDANNCVILLNGLEDEVFAGLSVDERCQLYGLLRQALDGGAEPAD